MWFDADLSVRIFGPFFLFFFAGFGVRIFSRIL